MFELYNPCEKTCPERVDVGGETVGVNADFRNILKIIAVLGDREVPRAVQARKLREWFFKGGEGIRPDEAVRIFVDFVRLPGAKQSWYSGSDLSDAAPEERERQFDYYVDSEEIYASFMSEYGINLIRVDYLHWYEFSMLCRNLSRGSAFKRKLELRFMDLGVYSRNSRGYAEMARAKRAVQLPVELSAAEMREIEAFDDEWGRV